MALARRLRFADKARVLPTADAILRFIADSPTPVGKREIARAFALAGPDKLALKALLREMADAGQLGRDATRSFHRGGGLPRVTVLRVVEAEEGATHAVPDRWDGPGPPPRVRLIERSRQGALGLGDRVLARIEEAGQGYRAHPMKRLERREELILGVLRRDGPALALHPADKRARFAVPVSDPGDAKPGDLVLAEPHGHGARRAARVVERLGDPFAPRSFSLIAIHQHRLPHVFPPEAEAESRAAAAADLGPREDLTHLPFLTIDPADARDHDDALWAEPLAEGGHRLVVAIADVAWFVRPGTALDRAARERGNSVYFPDRVVPMLPHALSSDACSLLAGRPRAVLACHLELGPKGVVRSARFARALIRCVENIAYEDAQAAIDSGAPHPQLTPVWAAWTALAAARAKREPLDLDLPERRVVLDEAGRVAAIATRDRLDSHRVVEECMIAANVAAARALEAKRTPCMYRDHEPPGREKLIALKDYLATLGQPFALGQVIRPALFNAVIARAKGTEHADAVQEQVLRTQTQAYYAPANTGHFGLSLASYAHFTSPIRRYADVLVHRALVRAYDLGEGGLTDAEAQAMPRAGEHISQTERRAMEAERDTVDRYVAAHLAERVGTVVAAKITGVARFGLFATVEGVGGDGLLPMSALGDERFTHDEAARALEGASGTRYTVGQRLELRLAAADPVTGALRFALADTAPAPPRRDRVRRRR